MKIEAITSQHIGHALVNFYGTSVWSPQKTLAARNTKALGHEADLLIVQPSNYCYEIEIKISVSDFKREFTHKPAKHKKLENGKYVRKFFFAMPKHIFEKVSDLIPHYAGVILFDPSTQRCTVTKQAPVNMGCAKLTGIQRAKIMESVYYTYWNQQQAEYRKNLGYGKKA